MQQVGISRPVSKRKRERSRARSAARHLAAEFAAAQLAETAAESLRSSAAEGSGTSDAEDLRSTDTDYFSSSSDEESEAQPSPELEAPSSQWPMSRNRLRREGKEPGLSPKEGVGSGAAAAAGDPGGVLGDSTPMGEASAAGDWLPAGSSEQVLAAEQRRAVARLVAADRAAAIEQALAEQSWAGIPQPVALTQQAALSPAQPAQPAAGAKGSRGARRRAAAAAPQATTDLDRLVSQIGVPLASQPAAAAAAAGGVRASALQAPSYAQAASAAETAQYEASSCIARYSGAAEAPQAGELSEEVVKEALELLRLEAVSEPLQILGHPALYVMTSMVDTMLRDDTMSIQAINLLTDGVKAAAEALDSSRLPSDRRAVAEEVDAMCLAVEPVGKQLCDSKLEYLALELRLTEVPFLVGPEREEAEMKLVAMRESMIRAMIRVQEVQLLLSLPAAGSFRKGYMKSVRQMEESDQSQLARELQRVMRARSRNGGKLRLGTSKKKGGRKASGKEAISLRELAELRELDSE